MSKTFFTENHLAWCKDTKSKAITTYMHQ